MPSSAPNTRQRRSPMRRIASAPIMNTTILLRGPPSRRNMLKSARRNARASAVRKSPGSKLPKTRSARRTLLRGKMGFLRVVENERRIQEIKNLPRQLNMARANTRMSPASKQRKIMEILSKLRSLPAAYPARQAKAENAYETMRQMYPSAGLRPRGLAGVQGPRPRAPATSMMALLAMRRSKK